MPPSSRASSASRAAVRHRSTPAPAGAALGGVHSLHRRPAEQQRVHNALAEDTDRDPGVHSQPGRQPPTGALARQEGTRQAGSRRRRHLAAAWIPDEGRHPVRSVLNLLEQWRSVSMVCVLCVLGFLSTKDDNHSVSNGIK